jgi:hypothetical protein
MALLWTQALLLVTMAMADGVQGTVEKELLYMETPYGPRGPLAPEDLPTPRHTVRHGRPRPHLLSL